MRPSGFHITLSGISPIIPVSCGIQASSDGSHASVLLREPISISTCTYPFTSASSGQSSCCFLNISSVSIRWWHDLCILSTFRFETTAFGVSCVVLVYCLTLAYFTPVLHLPSSSPPSSLQKLYPPPPLSPPCSIFPVQALLTSIEYFDR